MTAQPQTQLTIRRLGDHDARRLRRLAERDSSKAPGSEMLGAERDGRLIAAIAIDPGDEIVLADPFEATADAVELLRIRREQLAPAAGRRTHLPRLRPPRRAHAALAGSPPGGGTRLLRL